MIAPLTGDSISEQGSQDTNEQSVDGIMVHMWS